MPIIAAFFGIIIRMFYREHEPGHFHAEHQGQQGKFDFDGNMMVGNIRSRTALRLIREMGVPASNGAGDELGEDEGRAPAGEDPAARLRSFMTLPQVIRAEYRGGHRIRVTFNDDTEKTIDFRPWLDGPVFEPLRDVDYFRRFFVDGGTVVWPNGADIAPETLYECPGVEEAA
jgi:hypothetical protein